jgi:hypothetical protein
MLKWVRLATETLRHREEVRSQISEIRFQKTEDRRWGDRKGRGDGESQRSEVRSQKTEGKRADQLGKKVRRVRKV